MKIVGIGVALVVMVSPVYAAYDPTDPLTAYVEFAWRDDSNVFNIGNLSGTSFSSEARKGSLVFNTQADVRYSYVVSRQTFFVDSDVFRKDFQKFSDVDYNGWHNSAGWNWAIGDRANGVIQYFDDHDLAEFNNLSLGPGDLVRHKETQGSFTYQINANWGVTASASSETFSHNQLDYLDLSANSKGFGLIWAADKGISVTVRRDSVNVDYADDYQYGFVTLPAASRGFKQSSTGLQLTYPYSDILSMDVSESWVGVTQKYDNSHTDNTFSGADVNWQATPKTKLTIGYQRQYNAPGSDSSSTVTAARTIQGKWQYSSKISFNAQQYIGNTTYGQLSVGGARAERITAYRLGSDWLPKSDLDVSAYMQRTSRVSPLPMDEFGQNQIGMAIRVKF